jgi:MoaA/NifB/PqqE/SkfB family radical SAM enzyme
VEQLRELIVELSQNCNLDCIMCGFGKTHNSPRKFLSFDDFVTLYDKLGNFTDKIRLNGRGESTIHPDFKKIVKYIGFNNKMSLFTNGNYVDHEINELYINFDIELYFSMDSPYPEKLEQIRRGVSFNRLDYNIQSMSLKKTRPFIIFTLQECNIDDIIPMAKYAIINQCNLIYNVLRRDEGIEVFQNIVLCNKLNIMNDFDKAEKLFSGTNLNVYIPDQVSGIDIRTSKNSITCGSLEFCPNINKELCVLYNGDVTPCNMFNPYIYGNIKVNDIDFILNGEQKKWFDNNHKKYYYCKNCQCLVR